MKNQTKTLEEKIKKVQEFYYNLIQNTPIPQRQKELFAEMEITIEKVKKGEIDF
ncbi:hypothetical protein [Aeribacillus pallidus]|uniref:hypothetical protein n=1 Tax=Aeribacillus pallidus TaxID=33936 RepID=UPI003D23943A